MTLIVRKEFANVPLGGSIPNGTTDGSFLCWNETDEEWAEAQILTDNDEVLIDNGTVMVEFT
jgi:hypothetical protein